MRDKPLKVPFDSLTLAAVVAELQRFVGGKIQGIRQPADHEVTIGLYAPGGEAMLLLSCHPVFARAHLVTKRPANAPQPPAFCAALRARADGARVAFVRQDGLDRILHIGIDGPKGPHVIIAELMGKHSNLVLVDADGRIVSSAKTVGRSKSSRPVVSGMPYEPPPFESKPSLLDAREGDDLAQFEGASPFLRTLLAAMGPGALLQVQSRIRESAFEAFLSPGHGAYPISLAPLSLQEFSRSGIGIALEQHFNQAILGHEIESLRHSLLAGLRRISLAREVALADLEQAREAGEKAGRWQLMGELVLAYGATIQPGQSELAAWDYEGKEIAIRLDPQLGFKENANKLFERARKAKARLGMVHDQSGRLGQDKSAIDATIAQVEQETRLDRLRDLQELARSKRWLTQQTVQPSKREDRPYEGHRIRELLGPQGLAVLYGENAESNDYLTLRVAKPNDYWLHVRGNMSAHVVVVTGNHPEKVSKETLLFAAKIAVQNSPSKHSGYVPVDYTLRRYVRKPRGAPKGTALYTNEKTLHVDA